jgi:hypothetical protein
VDDGVEPPLEYVERVARFSLQDFERMFARHQLSIDEVHGDYRLNPYDSLTSPRLILVASKSGADAAAGYRRDRLLRTRLSVSGDTPRYDASIH